MVLPKTIPQSSELSLMMTSSLLLLLLLLLLQVISVTTLSSPVLLAMAEELPLNYTSGEKIPDSCSTFLYQTDCGLFQNDNKVQKSLFCPLYNKTALGLPTAFDGFPKDPVGPTVYCPNTGNPRFYEVPSYTRNTIQTITTLAGFIPGVTYDHESPISVITSDGVERRLGSFVPSVNTLVGIETTFRNRPNFFTSNAENNSWPYNGHTLCQGQTSYQVWTIPDSLRVLGVLRVKIYDVKGTLRVYAVTLDNCTAAEGHYVNYGDLTTSVTYNFSVTIDTTAVGTIEYFGVPDWPTCALRLAQQRQYSQVFLYKASTGVCSIVNSSGSFAKSASATTNVYIYGQVPRDTRQFAAISGVPSRTSTVADKYAMTRPDTYGNMTPYLILRTSTENNIDITLFANQLQSFAVGLGGALSYHDDANWLRLTTRAGGRVSLCGEPNITLPANNVAMPFIAKSGSNGTANCSRFYHCTPQQLYASNTASKYIGKIDIDYNTYPRNINCTPNVNQGLMTMVFTDTSAKLSGAVYRYTREYAAGQQFSDVEAAKEYFKTLHELTSTSQITQLETMIVGGRYRYFYSLEGDPRVSPSWRWSNSYRRSQSSALWCSAYHTPQYKLYHRTTPNAASTTNSCGSYGSIFEISKACMSDSTCLGYTIIQDAISYDETPGCLVSAVGALESGELVTYAEKNVEKPTCMYPANNGRAVTVKVTSAVTSTTVYKIYADSILLGNCTALSTATVGKASCTELFSCWSGDVPENTANVIIVADTPAGFANPRCANHFMGAVVEFSLQSTYYEPEATCLNALDLITPSGCAATAVTAPCPGTRLVQNLTYPGTACTASSTTMASVYATVSPASTTTVGALVAVDMSGMAADVQGSALVTVLVQCEDTTEEPIGYIQRNAATGAMSFFSVDDTPATSYPTCSLATDVSTNSLANAHFFVIPQSLADKKIVKLELRGPNVKFVSAYLADTACLPVLFPDAADNYFGALTEDVMPTGPLISTTASNTYSECAFLCQSTTTCFIFAWKANQCYMYNSLGAHVTSSTGTTVGTKPRSTTVFTTYDKVAVAGSTVGDIVGDMKMAGFDSVTAFMTEASSSSGKSIRLLLEGVDKVQVAVAQTAFASSGFVAVGAASSGGVQSCGSYYNPFIGGSTGSSSQCESLLACRSLSFRATTNTHVSLTPIDADTSTTCTTKFWGLLASSGTVAGGSEFYRVAVTDASTSNSISDLTTSVTTPVIERFTSTVNGVSKRLILSEDGGIPANQLSLANTYYCRITTRTIFKVGVNGTIVAANKYGCGTLSTDVSAVMKACSTDANCKGFTTDVTGAPLCYSKVGVVDTTVSVGSTDIFWKRVTLTSCNFTMTYPGHISISVAQLHLGSTYANDVTILNNGKTLKKCGSTNPFLSPAGFVSETTSDCSTFIECFRGLVVAAGTLEIVFPQPADTASATPYSCSDAGGSHHFGAALVDYQPSAFNSRNPQAVAAKFPVTRTVSTIAQDFSFDFMVSLATSYAAEVKQDRYVCGIGCVTPFSLNVSLEERVRRCGGLAGFAEGTGLSNACRDYYYCGEIASDAAAVYPAAITGGIRLNMVADSSTAFCGNKFEAIVYTNGLMIGADGDGSNSVRTFYARSTTATTTSLPTTTMLKTNISGFVSGAHPEMSATDRAKVTVFDKVFPVTSNLETDVSAAYVIYDFLGVEEGLKSIHNGTIACAGDKISVDGQTVRCRFRVNSNYLAVRVAQTKFDSSDDYIKIMTSQTTSFCGGDNNFFGLGGLLDSCDTYFTCYTGYITPGEIVTIEFSSNTMIKSRCRPGVMALIDVEDRAILPPLNCTGDTPLECPLARTCLSISQICDRTTDCPDNSDEARCPLWKAVGTQLLPSCAPMAFDSTSTTETACKRFAILQSTPTVLTYNSSGCAVYDCVDFTNPQLRALPAATGDGTTTNLMVYTRDPFSFLYCTADLQCNGNGVVSSTEAPCACTCDFNYLGKDCASARRTDYSSGLVFVYPAYTTINAGVTSPLINALLLHLQTSSTVAVRFVEKTTSYTFVYLLTKDPSGVATSSYELNTLFYNSTYTNIMKYVSANGGGIYFTTENSNAQEREVQCRISSLNVSDATDRTCSTLFTSVVNDPHTLTVEIQGVQFSTDDQYVDVTLLDAQNNSLTVQRCSHNNSVNTRDSTITGSCGYQTSCAFHFNSSETANSLIANVARISTRLSSGMNPLSVVCNGYLGNVVTKISGRSSMVEDVGDTSVPSSATEREAIYLYLFFGILAIGVVTTILFVTWFRLRTKHPKMFCIGPLLAGISLFLIGFGFCALGFYLATETANYSHMIIVEDYRDEMCTNSPISSLPLSTSIAPANGKCNRVLTSGRIEGSLFVSASYGANKAGIVSFRAGASLRDCEADTHNALFLQSCDEERAYMPWKPQKDGNYVSLRASTIGKAHERLEQTRTNNPHPGPTVPVEVTVLPATQKYSSALPDSLKFVYDREKSQTIRVPNPSGWYMVPSFNDSFNTFSAISEVRFQETIEVERTLFTTGGGVAVDSLPANAVISNDSTYYPAGALFNSFDVDYVINGRFSASSSSTSSSSRRVESAVSSASIFAYYFLDIPATTLQMAESKEFTLTFWTKMTRADRGFVFATTDSWLTDSGTSPILTELANLIESGGVAGGEIFLQGSLSEWTVYSAIYISGYSQEVYLLTATSNKAVEYIRWSVEDVGASRLFNGGWHFLTVTSLIRGSSREYQLYVDGQSDPTMNGWVKCNDFEFPAPNVRSTGDTVHVMNDREESVLPGEALVVGQLDGGVFGIRLYTDRVYTQEEIFLLGADGMDNYYSIAVAESLVIGIVTAILTAVMVLYSLYRAFRREFGVNEDEFEDEAVYDERGRRIYTDKKAQSRSTAFTSSVRFSSFIEPFLLLLQVITLFITMWTWPNDYSDYFAPVAFVSFDLNYFLPGIPLITWVLITYIIAMVLFGLFVAVVAKQAKGFETVVDRYRDMIRVRGEKKNRKKKLDDELFMLDLPKPNYKWFVNAKGGTRQLTDDQEELLVENLKEICTARTKRETNMRVFTKKLVDMGEELGEGIILYERLQGRIFISFRISMHDLQHDQQSTKIDVTQTYFELRCDNVSCPDHKHRLLPEDIHNVQCVHSSNPYYRSKECPTKCVMYICPEEGCEYAVCEHCYGGGALGGGVADAMQKIKSAKKKGITHAMGSMLMLLTGLIYMPSVKYALMIISCHNTYRCEFDGCWESPSITYLGMVLFSVLILVCIGVGFIYLQIHVLVSRRSIMAEVLPLQTRKHGGGHNTVVAKFLAKRTVLREDYIDFLELDNTIAGAIYRPYEYDFFATSPLLLFYRFLLTIVVVLISPNTLFQLGGATLVSLIFCFMLIIISPYVNVWLELLVRLGAFHNLTQLALFSLHRVDIRDDPNGGGYTSQMVAVTFLYIGIVGLLLIITVLVPFLRKKWSARERRDKEATAREEENYDIGFWGESHGAGQASY